MNNGLLKLKDCCQDLPVPVRWHIRLGEKVEHMAQKKLGEVVVGGELNV